jgi:hypothetical protein
MENRRILEDWYEDLKSDWEVVWHRDPAPDRGSN